MTTFCDAPARIKGTEDLEGGALRVTALAARTGVQVYRRNELGMDGEGMVGVYRPPEVVFARDSIATYAAAPVTIDHPPHLVTAETWKKDAVGEVSQDIVREGEHVRVTFTVRDADAVAAIRAGKRQISMGYTTPVEARDGTAPDGTSYGAVQTGPIVINHLAIVDAARGGTALRIGDDAGSWGASPITDAQKEVSMTTRKIMVDGLEVETTDAGAAAITKLQGQISDGAKALTDMKAKHEEDMAEKDKALAKKDARIDELEKSQLSDSDLDKRVQARAKLIGDAAKVVKDVQTDGLSDADIRKAVVAAKLGDKLKPDASDAYIEARFDALVEDAGDVDPVADAAKGQKPGTVTDMNVVLAERNKRLEDAWKTPQKETA